MDAHLAGVGADDIALCFSAQGYILYYWRNKMNNGKFCEEVVTEICNHIRVGCTARDACQLSGITETSFYEWKKKKPEFVESIKRAEILNKKRAIALIQKAGEETWQANAWFLERRYPNEYGKQRIEISGKIESTVTIISEKTDTELEEIINAE